MHFPKTVGIASVKIQSISDLITNSSSESFVIYNREGIQLFKDIVATLIEDDFDKHFNLELVIDEYHALDYYEERSKEDENLTLEDWCFKYDANTYEGSPLVEGFTITAKDPKDIEKAKKLNQIYSLFDSETRYC